VLLKDIPSTKVKRKSTRNPLKSIKERTADSERRKTLDKLCKAQFLKRKVAVIKEGLYTLKEENRETHLLQEGGSVPVENGVFEGKVRRGNKRGKTSEEGKRSNTSINFPFERGGRGSEGARGTQGEPLEE